MNTVTGERSVLDQPYIAGLDVRGFQSLVAERWPALANRLCFNRSGTLAALDALANLVNEFDCDSGRGRGDSYRRAQLDPLVRWCGIRQLLDLAGGAPMHLQSGEGTVLDALGGQCTTSRAVAAVGSGPTVVTADIAASMVGRALNYGLPALRQDVRFMYLADGTFDAVILAYGTHHIPPADRENAYRECRRILRPGGRLVVHDFRPTSAVARWFVEVVHRYAPGGHAYEHL